MYMNLTEGLHRGMQQTSDTVVSVFKDRRRTFAEFGARVARAAGMLRGLGLEDGDRVAMLALNSDWYLEYYPAVYWAGGVVVPLNTRWSPAENAFALNDCEPRILIVDDSFVGMAGELRKRCPGLETVIHIGDGEPPEDMVSYEALLAQAAPAADARRGGEDLAGIYYTSGTTGQPKGVMLSHRSLYVNSMAVVAEDACQPGCTGLHAAPMFHLADGCFMNSMSLSGGTHVMVSGFAPVAVLEVLQNEGVTDVLLVPTMIQMLVDHPDAGKYRLDGLKRVIYGASPISEAVLERAMRTFPSCDFIQAYGQTELSPVATLLGPEMHRAAGCAKGRHRSAGRASMGNEVRIVDPEDNEVSRGGVGQIAVRGPGVMLGYWNKPDETAAALRDGWMHTGDAGYMDEEGYVFLVDRIKDMIVSGGENVYSVEVENALATHPAVASCAVIGVPDERFGEMVHAFVVKQPDASLGEQELIDHCKEQIAGYKCPRQVSFVEALPLSGSGKILKTELRKPFWEGRERGIN